jgi:Ni,Fe-hydrogenase III large subunit
MVGLDLSDYGGGYAVEFVFSLAAFDEFLRIRADLPEHDRSYPSVTRELPAANWYEREARDLLGLIPQDHPDPRALVLHETWPHGYHPLRKDVSPTEAPPRGNRHFDYFEVRGEGVYELPVGPIHAGIIEPGHFRFSNIGELILHLDARLFFTHRGVEKLVEGKTIDEALFTVERTCGVCTVSHGVSFSQAAERLAAAEIPSRAAWLRSLLMELERLYNHVGDIGNICAGTGFHIGSMRGAVLKERLQRLNERLTGHRFLMGIVAPGGLRYDLDSVLLADAKAELAGLQSEFKAYLDTILDTPSFVTRIEGPGKLDAATVLAFGGAGITARAAGVATDYRRDHPHAAYGDCPVEPQLDTTGDVAARLRVRAGEALASFNLARDLIDGLPGGAFRRPVAFFPAGASALGYSESPRGANVHWLMVDGAGRIGRLRIRSAAYANWPLVARAVVENIVPDFPLINKSFELCYACCDR